MNNLLSLKILFSSNQLFSIFFSKNVTFTRFLPKMCETKSQQFPHCAVGITEIYLLSPKKNFVKAAI